MSKLSSKHQVTIPVSILREAGLAARRRGRHPSERPWTHRNRASRRTSCERFAGSLPAGTYPDGYLDELRGEWRE